ncbi:MULTISPECIES: hypothetical protein [unclassified Nocardiopsis]|uniref:hypothetical protein n=1 Tax=unclassified Nocardiopsis TaxID=2649073 RepID=UPI001160EC63|nr:hypothetical protein [Nocardiopsis sp. TSRI0078]
MRVLLFAMMLTLLTAGCSSGADGETTPAPEQRPEEFFTQSESPPAPKTRPESMPPATATATGKSRYEPPSAPSTPAPEPEAPDVTEGVPSVEEQIQQCIEQTGLSEECRNKIEHGIVE